MPTKWKSAEELGNWEWTAGEWFGGSQDDKGIKTGEDSRFYGLSSKFSETFTQDTDLVIQLSIKHEQKLDCGGAYVKLLGEINQDSFGSETPYQV